MSIIPELHCTWQLQSLGNRAATSHDEDALYMLCEDRNCEWTDVLKSVTSSMNAMINSATGVSQHYTITGHHSNIGLPKLHKMEFANDDPGAYGM